MGILSRGQDMLNRRLKESEGVEVTYTRKGYDPVTLTARVGRTIFSGLVESAVSVQWGERDFLIEVADLVLGGSPTTPQRGDRVTHDGQVFEVAGPQTDEPPWRYSDNGRTVYRIHTKRAG